MHRTPRLDPRRYRGPLLSWAEGQHPNRFNWRDPASGKASYTQSTPKASQKKKKRKDS